MRFIPYLIILLTFYSCTSVSYQDVNPVTENPAVNCDTLAVTFSGTITPIISTNCLECHAAKSPTSGISFGTYSEFAIFAKNGSLYKSIIGAPGYQQMPQDKAPLSACDIQKIKNWIDAGYPNN